MGRITEIANNLWWSWNTEFLRLFKMMDIDLWDRLLNLLDIYDVSCHWVKGHSTNYYNNRCDEMAVQERLKLE